MFTAFTRRPVVGAALAVTLALPVAIVAGSPAAHAQSSMPFDLGSLSQAVEVLPPSDGDVSLPADQQKVLDDVVRLTNERRAAAGASQLTVDPRLSAIAQRWSERQAADDRMYHNPDIAAQVRGVYGSAWSEYGENVLRNRAGADGRMLVDQWMNSLPHRLNLLNGFHNRIGVGLALAPSGNLYATQELVHAT